MNTTSDAILCLGQFSSSSMQPPAIYCASVGKAMHVFEDDDASVNGLGRDVRLRIDDTRNVHEVCLLSHLRCHDDRRNSNLAHHDLSNVSLMHDWTSEYLYYGKTKTISAFFHRRNTMRARTTIRQQL